MRFLFSMIALIAIIFNLQAQIKTTNLYDLIKSALPDSSSSISLTDWKKGISLNPAIKWDDKTPRKVVYKGVGGKKDVVTYFKDGGAKLLLPNKKTDAVSVNIEGETLQGYSGININTTGFVEDYTLEKLLGNKNCSITLLKKEGEGFPFYYYKVKFPGKKDVWIMLNALLPGTMNGEEEKTLSIFILFDYNEFKNRAL